MSTDSNYFFAPGRRSGRFIKGTPHKHIFFDSPHRWAFPRCFEHGYLSTRMSYNTPAFPSEFHSNSAARETDFGRKIIDVVDLGEFLSGKVCFFGVRLTKSRRELNLLIHHLCGINSSFSAFLAAPTVRGNQKMCQIGCSRPARRVGPLGKLVAGGIFLLQKHSIIIEIGWE